ncbi:hypothetical protein T4B_10370 [Trichinella pseudospiralis]|uniref:Uncharacterized protein n=1 Tax=Trichinella pseudospiralis TaxID=6337 RepID=A0A0V1IS33_TRIPS|nr:hypothetical protein T4B_10370 [Trichinella pseudospiralis]
MALNELIVAELLDSKCIQQVMLKFPRNENVLLIETKKSMKCTVENVDDLLNYFSNSPNQFFTSVNRESIASADNGT